MSEVDFTDQVNHPKHYNKGRIEVIEMIEDQELCFHLGNALKYICRAGSKDENKYVQDLEKALWYIRRRIAFYLYKKVGMSLPRPNEMPQEKVKIEDFYGTGFQHTVTVCLKGTETEEEVEELVRSAINLHVAEEDPLGPVNLNNEEPDKLDMVTPDGNGWSVATAERVGEAISNAKEMVDHKKDRTAHALAQETSQAQRPQ